MCIRDSEEGFEQRAEHRDRRRDVAVRGGRHDHGAGQARLCLLYTSEAADERSSVDLGGLRIL